MPDLHRRLERVLPRAAAAGRPGPAGPRRPRRAAAAGSPRRGGCRRRPTPRRRGRPASRPAPSGPRPAAPRARRPRRRSARPGPRTTTVTRGAVLRASPGVRRPAAGPRARPPTPRRRAARRPARRRGGVGARARTRRARSATSPARHDVHAFGEVARASASVSTSSRSSVSTSGIRSTTYATVAGSSRSRVVATSASSRCQRTRPPTSVDLARRRSPSGRRPPRRAAPPRREWSTSWPLPMSCSSAAAISTSGRETRRISRDASMQVSTRCRSTVNRCTTEACGSSRTRSHSGSTGRQRAGLVEGLPDGEQARPGGQQPGEQVARLPAPGLRQRGALRGPAGPRSAGRSTSRRSAASAAARSSSSGSSRRGRRPGRGPPRRARPPPRGRRARARGRAGGRPAGRASTASTRCQVSRDRWVIRRPSLADLPLGGLGVGEAEPGREVRPDLGGDPVGGPPGDGVQHVADVEQLQPAGLEVGVRDVDQPGGDQRLEHGRVPQPAHGLLEVGDRGVGQLAHAAPRGGSPAPAARAAGCARRAASAASRSARSRRVRDGSPARCRASSRPSATRGSSRAVSRDLRERAHRVVEVGAAVPERVPDVLRRLRRTSTPSSWTSTTSRSLCGASSARP